MAEDIYYNCDCPEGELEKVTTETCSPTKQNKVQFILIRKKGNADFVDLTNGISEADSWAGLMDATDDTLVIRTPDLKDFIWGEAEKIEGSENFDGATTIDAVRPQSVTAVIENINPDNAKQLDGLFCNAENLSFTAVYASGRMHASRTTDVGVTPAAYNFIDISPNTWITTPPSREADLGSKFMYTIEFKIAPSWYSNSWVVAPEDGFSYIDDLKPI